MSDRSQIFGEVRSLIAANKLGDAATKLKELASQVDGFNDVELQSEYYYLLATTNFSSQTHAEVLRQAETAYELVAATAANELVGRIQALIAASTVGWGIFGFLVGSAAQVGFSLIYGTAALFNAVRFLRGGGPHQ